MAMAVSRCRERVWFSIRGITTGLLFIIFSATLCMCAMAASTFLAGGIKDVPNFQHDPEIQSLAHFAVDEYNKQQNILLSFSKVVKAQKQVVAGMIYYLTIEAVDGHESHRYSAKILVVEWRNIKQLQEFKPMPPQQPSSLTPADLGGKQGGSRESGWQTVPTQDPVVQEAAENAVKIIQQRSNSLAPYQLQDVLSAKAEIFNGSETFDLDLKIKWGTKEEQCKVEILQSPHGRWTLNDVQCDKGH